MPFLQRRFPLPFFCAQTIRQLENNIEKMHVSIATAEKVYILYVKMLDVLRDVSPVWLPPVSLHTESFCTQRDLGLIQMGGSPSVRRPGGWGSSILEDPKGILWPCCQKYSPVGARKLQPIPFAGSKNRKR